MNIQKALELLKTYLNKYGNTFVIHPKFITELSSLIKKELKGQENLFFKRMVAQLDNIVTFRETVNTVDSNEILKAGNTKNGTPLKLYSIHITAKQFNIRFIICFNQKTNPLLLSVFFERSGKKKTDYSSIIETATQRRLELLKGDDTNE